ncbi:Glycerophosphodiester phosphodiesterase GDPDL7 [Abeliophyllum distichum]|uniref:glycerophosphodiester phosphodiesterase n=1 Tax=Abeliophyllum distichum TaxID=126358 RepID=A0ABD1VBT8_9LAMI
MTLNIPSEFPLAFFSSETQQGIINISFPALFMFKTGEKMIGYLLFFVFLIHTNEAKGGMGKPPPLPSKKWMTLSGGEPQIVANGGFSGLFPASSIIAYDFAASNSLPGTILLCDLQFTRDGQGFCESALALQNTTNVDDIDPKGQKTYNVNGQEIHGWFGLDYDAVYLFNNVTLNQNLFTRPPWWDGQMINMPQDVVAYFKTPPRFWLNVQYDSFYNQHRISPEDFILSSMVDIKPEFISSPEIGFLKSIGPKVKAAKTKLIFKFLGADVTEPTTKEKYSSLATKLPMIKSFASGIVVPKDYIWPSNNGYLQTAPTNLVLDAHKQGLEVYASFFANDDYLTYNYSYDPTREYLQYVDNSQFSVDGVLTDFPVTASATIGCLYQNKNASRTIKTLIISHDGASGDFPGSTDLAYQKAIEDGVDIIDCSVQLSKDGVAFCLTSADLTDSTTAASLFMDQATTIQEIQSDNGIFSFDLTWTEIQSVKPQIQNSFRDLIRNPQNKNKGKFVTLSEFLELAKTKAATGVLINIENAAYLASDKGLDIVETVSTALSNATFDKQSTQKVLIQSDDSSVLLKFKDIPNYQRVLTIKKDISGTPAGLAQEVKKYADAISVIRRDIITSTDTFFTKNFTNIVPAMHAANVSVYVGVLKNEFQNLLLDYYSDPYVEIATLVDARVDGLITDYPATANSYMRSPCHNKAAPYKISGVRPGEMYASVQPTDQAPTPTPTPAPDNNGPLLTISDIVDPPLPPVAKISTSDSASNTTSTGSTPTTAPAPKSSSSSATVTKAGVYIAAVVGVLGFLTLG